MFPYPLISEVYFSSLVFCMFPPTHTHTPHIWNRVSQATLYFVKFHLALALEHTHFACLGQVTDSEARETDFPKNPCDGFFILDLQPSCHLRSRPLPIGRASAGTSAWWEPRYWGRNRTRALPVQWDFPSEKVFCLLLHVLSTTVVFWHLKMKGVTF